MPELAERVRYTVQAKIVYIEEHFRPRYIAGIGKDATFDQESLGWFILLDGSHEAIQVGRDKPDWKKGETVRISFERVPDAKSV